MRTRGHSFWTLCAASLLVLLLAAHGVCAQESGLQVRAADREQLTKHPREVVVLTFSVRNTEPHAVAVQARLVLPDGWSAITPEMPFTLSAGASTVRMVSFVVPEMAQAGDHAVTYEVTDRQAPVRIAAHTVRITIAASLVLQVLSLEAPDYVIAGESYESRFLLRNRGNGPITAQFKAKSIQGDRVEPREGFTPLAPGESKTVTVKVYTQPVRRRIPDDLTLTVRAAGTDLIESATSPTQIIPRVSADDSHRTLATRLDMRLIASEDDGKRASAWQPELSGSGALDEAQTHQLSFRFRGPDTRERGALGEEDEYRLQYRHDALVANLGDHSYGLSMLTEPGRYGRGGLLGYRSDHWGIQGYRMRDRFGSEPFTHSGVNAYYAPWRDTQLDINLLRTDSETVPGTVESIRGRTRWANGVSTDIELGQSSQNDEHGRAFRASIQGATRTARYYAVGWKADPQFSGYLRDKKYFNTGFDYQRNDWALRGYYRVQDWNLELPDSIVSERNPEQSIEDWIRNAPTERQATLGAEHSFLAHTRVTFDYSVRNRTDRYTEPELDVASQSARVGIGRSWRDLSLLYSLERGVTHNRGLPTRFDTSLQVLSAAWRLNDSHAYSLYALRDENAFANEPGAAQTTFGLNASYDLASTTSLSFDVQRNYSRPASGEAYYMTLAHEFFGGGKVSLVLRRLESGTEQTDMLLTGSIPFGMPVGRRSDVGAVQGRVFDSETGTGVSHLLLSLDGLTAVTDHDGEFRFPAVATGNYRLSMEKARIAVSQVPVENVPRELSVAPRQANDVQIALVRAVTISVHVRLQSARANATASPKTSGLHNVLVTLKNGEDVYRRLTDEDGIMRLGGLRPGKWIVSIPEDAIPADCVIAAREMELDVPPGASANAELVITPAQRRMRMVAPPQALNAQPK